MVNSDFNICSQRIHWPKSRYSTNDTFSQVSCFLLILPFSLPTKGKRSHWAKFKRQGGNLMENSSLNWLFAVSLVCDSPDYTLMRCLQVSATTVGAATQDRGRSLSELPIAHVCVHTHTFVHVCEGKDLLTEVLKKKFFIEEGFGNRTIRSLTTLLLKIHYLLSY